jgi:hypothetical protein
MRASRGTAGHRTREMRANAMLPLGPTSIRESLISDVWKDRTPARRAPATSVGNLIDDGLENECNLE